MSKSFLVLLLIAILVCSCTSNQPSVTTAPSAAAINAPTQEGKAPEPTKATFPTAAVKTPTSSAAPSPAHYAGYQGLPDGEYILFFFENQLIALSVATKEQTIVLSSVDSVHFSPDKKTVVGQVASSAVPTLINLETMAQENLPFLKGCYNISLSPDGQFFLSSCFLSEKSFEVYLFSRDGKHRTQLTNCAAERGDCSGAVYSPDGKWISYYWNPAGAIQTTKSGMYLIPADCMQTDRCENEVRGPFSVNSDFVWAPNSKYLASSGDNAIVVHEWNGQSVQGLQALKDTPSRFMAGFLAWSVTGDRIVYTDSNTTKIISFPEGELIDQNGIRGDVYLKGWIQVADGKLITP